MKRVLQLSYWLMALVLLISAGCRSKTEAPPPASPDGVSDGRSDSTAAQPAAAPATETSKEKKFKKYTIQVGSFDNKDSADSLAYALRAERISNFIERADGQWRVCVGRYFSQGRAGKTLRLLHERGFYSAEVIGWEPQS
jgi:cell division septation protein DedD